MTNQRVCVCDDQDDAIKIKKEASDLDKLIDKTEKEYNDLRDDLKSKEQEVRRLLEKGKSEQQVSSTPNAGQVLHYLSKIMLQQKRITCMMPLSSSCLRLQISCWLEPMLPKLWPRRRRRRASPRSGRPRASWRTCVVLFDCPTVRLSDCPTVVHCLILFVSSDFDKRVNDNKTAAEDAMKKIPAINATIIAANNKTRQAEAALGNAAADAREAKNKAEEAEKIASNVQKV